MVDIIGIVLILQPIVTWLPLAFLTGYFAEMNEIQTASLIFTIHYLCLVVWEIIYDVVLAYFWYKLMSVIKDYIKLLEHRHLSSGIADYKHVDNIRKGTRNVGFFLKTIFFNIIIIN